MSTPQDSNPQQQQQQQQHPKKGNDGIGIGALVVGSLVIAGIAQCFGAPFPVVFFMCIVGGLLFHWDSKQ